MSEEERPIGPLPRSPCSCGIATVAFYGSLEHLKKLAKDGDKAKVKEQLEKFVIPNQEDFNKVCTLPVGATPAVGAHDILAFDLRKHDWQERIEKEASSLQFRIENRLHDCIKKEIVREQL